MNRFNSNKTVKWVIIGLVSAIMTFIFAVIFSHNFSIQSNSEPHIIKLIHIGLTESFFYVITVVSIIMIAINEEPKDGTL